MRRIVVMRPSSSSSRPALKRALIAKASAASPWRRILATAAESKLTPSVYASFAKLRDLVDLDKLGEAVKRHDAARAELDRLISSGKLDDLYADLTSDRQTDLTYLLRFSGMSESEIRFYAQAHSVGDKKAIRVAREKLRGALNLGFANEASIACFPSPIDLKAFVNGVFEVVRETGEKTVGDISRQLGKEVVFNPVGRKVNEFMTEHGAALVTNISESTRESLRRVLVESVSQRKHPLNPSLLRSIKDLVGLTAPHATAVFNYREKLLTDGYDEDKAEELSSTYAKRLHNYRAKMIARQETHEALSGGIQATWEQAADDGHYEATYLERTWITSQDERVSAEICRPMHGQKRKLKSPFVTGDGRKIERPTAHIQCRCDVLYEIKDLPAVDDTPENPVDRTHGKEVPARPLKPV